jgi:hypothetical protein
MNLLEAIGRRSFGCGAAKQTNKSILVINSDTVIMMMFRQHQPANKGIEIRLYNLPITS